MNILIIIDDTKGESKEIMVLTSDTISICKKNIEQLVELIIMKNGNMMEE